MAREALWILQQDFPGVLTVGSFIYGLPGDTPQTVRRIHELACELGLDQFFFIPLTPLPGTAGWSPEFWDPTGEAFREFNFLPSGRPHGRHAELERALLLSVLFNWPAARWRMWLRQLRHSDLRQRRVYWRLQLRSLRLHARTIMNALVGSGESGMIFPRWYES